MIPTATSSATQELHLPLEPFLALLRKRGFIVKPDDYLEVLRLVRQFGTHDLDETAEWLCPVLATNPFEQSLFYTVLEEYKSKQMPVPVAEPDVKRNWLKKYAWIPAFISGSGTINLILWNLKFWWIHAAFLALVIWMIIKVNAPPPLIADMPVLKNHYLIGDTIFLEASGVFQKRLKDTAETFVFWRLNNDLPVKGYRAPLIVKQEGPIRIIQSLRSGNIDTARSRDTATSYACGFVPEFDLVADRDIIQPGEQVNISALLHDSTLKEITYQWYQTGVIDTTVNGDSAISLRFDSTGLFQISCTIAQVDGFEGCSVTKEIVVEVKENRDLYSLDMRMAGVAWEAPKPKIKKILHWLLLLPSIAGILFFDFWKRRKNKKPPAETGNENQSAPENIANLKPVFEVPFEKRDTKLIADESSLKKVFNQMRQKTESDFLQLNIGETVQSITKSGGIPNLIFSPRMNAKEFLLLIDRSNPKSMMTAFYDWFARAMADANIPVTVIYFDQDFRCYHKDFPLGISLFRCGQLYSHYILLICGNGHNLLDRAYPVPNPVMIDSLNQWEEKAILTPIPYPDWTAKEKAIGEKIILLPADLETLEYLMPSIREKSLNTARFLHPKNVAATSLFDWDFDDIAELKGYLDNDETLFQWLCSICLYPKIRWEVMVEAGNEICNRYKSPDLLNYSNLLKICRIPWIAEGTYPQRTRLQLLKELIPENELTVRQTIIGMLQTAKNIYGEGFYFNFEQEAQQETNEFVLYANDAKKFANYSESSKSFLSHWEKDLLTDAPMRRYLGPQEKDKWVTPLNHTKENEHAGLKLEALQKINHSRKRSWMEYVESVFGWGIILYLLLLFKVLPAQSKVFGIFYDQEPDKEVSFAVALQTRDTCLPQQVPYVKISSLDGDYPMQYMLLDDSAIIDETGREYGTITGQYNAFNQPGAKLIVGWTGGDEKEFDLLQLSDSILLTANCLPKQDTPIVQAPDTTEIASIPYIDSTNPAEIPAYTKSSLRPYFNEIWTGPNEKMAIDLNKSIIYTQLNNGTGIQQYQISGVFKSSTTTDLSIIGINQNGGFQKVIIKAGNSEQFQLIRCGTTYKEAEKALVDLENCDRKYAFSIHYAVDREKVFIPRNGVTYVNTEIMKIRQTLANMAEKIQQNTSSLNQQVQQQPQRGSYILVLNVNMNTHYYPTNNQQRARQEQIKKGWKYSGNLPRTDWKFTNYEGGPFDRDYINMTLQYLANEPAPEPTKGKETEPTLEKPSKVPLTRNQLGNIVEIARKEIGVTEEPKGSNKGPRINEYVASIGLKPGVAWSTAFIYWVYQQAGVQNKLRKTASVMQLWEGLNQEEKITQKEALANPSLIKPGNLFFIDFGNKAYQIGIVESIKGNSIFTIEGNSNDKGTSESISVIKGVRQLNNITIGFSSFGEKSLPAQAY